MKLPVGFWQGRTPAWTLCWPPLRERLGWKADMCHLCQLCHLQCPYLPSNRLLEICQANRTVTGKAILNPVLTVDPRPKLKTADLKLFINFQTKKKWKPPALPMGSPQNWDCKQTLSERRSHRRSGPCGGLLRSEDIISVHFLHWRKESKSA